MAREPNADSSAEPPEPSRAAAEHEATAERRGPVDPSRATRERKDPKGGSHKGGGRDRDRDRDRDRGRERGKPRANDRPGSASAPLKAGLFASIADKAMPCRVEGCARTWSWSGIDQMRNLGQAPPQRMCDTHLAELNELQDREVACRNPGCTNTWTWKRGTQLHQLQKTEALEPPSRLCAACFEAEKSLADTEVVCRVGGCRRTWTWTRDAQQKHRAWLRRLQAKIDAEERGESAEPGPEAQRPEGPAPAAVAVGDGSEAATAAAPPEGESGPKRRRKHRRRKRKLPEGPPEKMCNSCAARYGQLMPVEQPCKVHGCTRTWTWSKEHQLGAWAGLPDDATTPSPAPKRMCNTCRDFCRSRPDKHVPCGRPGCNFTWMWKTGAQLQAHLAGKTHDPIRLCDTCAKGEFLLAGAGSASLPPGAEVMPCVVPACGGTWTYLPGMKLGHSIEGELSPDRMCDSCRGQRGQAPRQPPAREPATTKPGGDGSSPAAATPAVEENSRENSAAEFGEGDDAGASAEPATDAGPSSPAGPLLPSVSPADD